MHYVSAALRLCQMQHDMVFTKVRGRLITVGEKKEEKTVYLGDMQKGCQTPHQPCYITTSYMPPLTCTEEAFGLADHSLDKFEQDLTANGSWCMLRLSFGKMALHVLRKLPMQKGPLQAPPRSLRGPCIVFISTLIGSSSHRHGKLFGFCFPVCSPTPFHCRIHPKPVPKPRIQIFAVFIGAFSSLSALSKAIKAYQRLFCFGPFTMFMSIWITV